jgi:hypothetical protein
MRGIVEVGTIRPFRCSSRPIHVQYRSVVSNPIGTIAQIDNAFDLEFSCGARRANVV